MVKAIRKRNDIILIFTLLLIGGILLLTTQCGQFEQTGDYVRVMVNNQLYGNYKLNEDQIIQIHTEDIDNVIEIINGKVNVTNANCRDQVCVKHPPISKDNEQIICLPNKVVIEIISITENSIDSLSE
ncbi:MAG: NusG domain II-containing protein [Clostridiales bacterium]|nr:NusG domain II-containing protein [Clostridiales bacterium]